MNCYNITETQLERAQKLYKFKALDKSIMQGKCNIVGALGEIMVHDIFENLNIKKNSTFNYDLMIKNHKIDVKTCKIKHEPNYNCNAKIPAYQRFQRTDFYFFGFVTADLKKYYSAGYISKKDFFKIATLKKEGENENNFVFRCDTYIVKIFQLNTFKMDKQTKAELSRLRSENAFLKEIINTQYKNALNALNFANNSTTTKPDASTKEKRIKG